MSRDIFIIQVIAPGHAELKKFNGTLPSGGWTIVIGVPDGDMTQAEISPYTLWDKVGMTADEALALLRHPLETIN